MPLDPRPAVTGAPEALPGITETERLFAAALEAARAWHESLPAAQAFCPWPKDLRYRPREAHPLPALDLMRREPGVTAKGAGALVAALQAVADLLEWRWSYTAEEVGQDFLNRFGWFELAGPEGHYTSQKARVTVGYWGPGLYYPRHQHPPAELYTILSGAALFEADGEAPRLLGPGDTKLHAPHQPHAMQTTDQPILALVFWRGDDLGADPRLSG